jgi:hypothetical protein
MSHSSSKNRSISNAPQKQNGGFLENDYGDIDRSDFIYGISTLIS